MLARPMVQISGRFIRQQQLRTAHKSPGNRNSLLLTTGDLANFVVQPMRKADSLQNLPGDPFRFNPIAATNEPWHHRVLERAKFRQKMMELKDKPDVTISESR